VTEVHFADTTIRDGPLSLWADGMRTAEILAVLDDLDQCGFVSIETIYAEPRKAVRELGDDPWERLRLLRERIHRTPIRIISGGFKAFSTAPSVMWEMQMECFGRIGIDEVRMSDPWNQPDRWKYKVQVARSVGIDPIVNLIFADSPKHTDQYYAERTKELAKLDVLRICLKDPGGVLTPERMTTLVPLVLSSAGEKEVEIHSHCTAGLGARNALRAVELGINIVSTGIPPLAEGTALPSVFSLARNLRVLGHNARLDEAAAARVREKLAWIAEVEERPEGRPVDLDVRQYRHQIPGGMLTNLRHQLKLIGAEAQFDAVLEECARVREEWGWPVMVTPLSQFVGSQAAINVISGERYREVTDQAILFALGRWGGREAIDGMDPNVRDRILDRPHSRELAESAPLDLTADEVRKRFGAPGMTDEELLLRYEIPDAELQTMRRTPPRSGDYYLDARWPLMVLLAELTKRSARRYIRVEKPTFRVVLRSGLRDENMN
jgi:oxaloacetate decarboxylase alpha subunit